MFDIITIGTATRDIFITSPLFKVVKDEKHLKNLGFVAGEATCFALGAKIEVGKPIFASGGGATNAATTFARQGFKTAALVKTGKDGANDYILNEFKKEKIESLAVSDQKFSTAFSIILLSPSGERTILVYRGASETIETKEVDFKKLNSRWAYMAPGKISLQIINKLINHFWDRGTLIVLNPSKSIIELGLKKLLPILKKTKVLVLNREEASYLTGIDYDEKEKIFEKIDEAVGGIFVMTDGKDGVWISDNKNLYSVKTFKSKRVDETGAGDAFASGFIAGLMHKKELCVKKKCDSDNIKYAIRLAAANSSSVVEHIGAKAGILAKKEFLNNKRWKNLKIKITKIQ